MKRVGARTAISSYVEKSSDSLESWSCALTVPVPQTTSSVDGQIRVWQLDSGTEPTCVQVLDGLIKAENAE